MALQLVLAPYPSSAQQSVQTEQKLSTRPLPPKQYAPSRDYDTRHIALDLHFDWEREQVLGTATITFAPLTSNLGRVEFDAANMTFTSVTLESGAELRFEADKAREKLRVTLDRVYQPADVLTVTIAYHTNGPTAESVMGQGGLTFIKPTPEEPNRPRQIWSQGESEWNHQWFPCFDHPNDFVTSELIATVEKPYTVISNGRLIGKTATPNGMQTFHWKMDEPHATYLSSIVVGDFATVEQSYKSVPIVSYVYRDQVEEAKVTVARVPEMMKFFEERTGVKFPYATYGQSFVHGFGGGMENITATTLSDQTIHDARSEIDRSEDGLLSHELAHSWFGNDVTCRNWSDVWLNEGFATYLAGLWTEHSVGHEDFLYLHMKGDQEGYLNAWAKGVRRPIVTKNYREPDALFDVYSYARSAAVLHMLRKWLGEDQWWRALNYYLRKHAHQPVETEEFRIAIEEATGKSFEWFFDEWVYKMGHPVFLVTQDFDSRERTLTLKVKQQQRIDPDSGFPQTKYFETPVEIEIVTEGKTRVERVKLEAKEEQSISFAVDSQPLLVNFDYGSTLIKELIFEKPTEALIYQLRFDEDMTGRLWALDQLAARARKKETPELDRNQISAAIGLAVKGDEFWGVREQAAQVMSEFAGNDARVVLVDALKDKDPRVRKAAVTSLGKRRDPSLADTFVELLRDRSYATIRAASIALGATKSDRAYDLLRQLTSVASWRNSIRASALAGLAVLGDSRALDLGLRYATSTNPVDVRLAALALLGSVGRGDARVLPEISEAFERAVLSGSTTSTDATAKALVELGDPKALKVFEDARNNAKKPELRFLITQFEQQLRHKLAAP